MPPGDVQNDRIKHHMRAIERLADACQVFVVAAYRDGDIGMIFCGMPDELVVRQALVRLAASDWNASKSH